MKKFQKPRRYFLIFSAMGMAICTSANVVSSTSTVQNQGHQEKLISCTLLNDPEGWSIDAWEPGNYCLEQDLIQHWPAIRRPHQRLPRSPFISIYSSNVHIDLKRHTLSGTMPILSGVYSGFSGNDNNLPTITNEDTGSGLTFIHDHYVKRPLFLNNFE